MAISHGLQADIQSLKNAHYDLCLYRDALKKGLEHYASMPDKKWDSYTAALHRAEMDIACVQIEIEKRRVDVGRVELDKEKFSHNRKMAA